MMKQKIFSHIKIRTLMFLSLFTVFILLLTVSNISLNNLRTVGDEAYLLNDGIVSLEKHSTLDSLAQFIRYYDEVLTQSARNYAFTSDKKWKDRYYTVVPRLDSVIKQSIQLGDDLEKDFFFKVNDANIALVELEEKSILFVDDGNPSSAVKILESQEYLDLKKEYQDPLIEYVNKRGKGYEDTLTSNVMDIRDSSEFIQKLLEKQSRNFIILISLLIPLLFFMIYYLNKKLSDPINKLVELIDSISNGDFKSSKIEKSKFELYEISKLKESLERIVKTMKIAILESQGSKDISYHEALEISEKNEKRFKILADSVPAILYSCKAGGNFDATYISKSIEDLGYTPLEFIKTENFWIDHIHPTDKKKVSDSLNKLLLTGYANYKYRFRLKNGSYKTIRDHSKLMKDQNGNPQEIIGLMYEVEDTKLSSDTSKLNAKNKPKLKNIPKTRQNLNTK